VSAALCLHSVLPKLRSSKIGWQLSEEERNDIKLQWYRAAVKRSAILEREFLVKL